MSPIHEADTVLVTGVGEQGSLGYELAKSYTAAGARVVITGRLDEYAYLADQLDPTGSRAMLWWQPSCPP